MKEKLLHNTIDACKKDDPSAQRKLFDFMYEYGMNVASRYGNTLGESEDIANEGFYKVLKNIKKYDSKIPFLVWVRRVIINCAIDAYRKTKNHKMERPESVVFQWNEGLLEMESDYLLKMVRSLPSQYKMVFNLHTIEGLTHEEISKKLNISKGTSKSNLAKAKRKLREMLRQYEKNTAYVRK